MKINKIRPLEHDFTKVLEMLVLNIKMLYYYGKMPKNVVFDGQNRRPKVVAIVGSRKNTSYGYEVAYNAAYSAAKAGAIVVSGLAYGIDSIAHRGALDAGGVTIGVLGTPIDEIYPSKHRGLAREIIEKNGAIISEYGPGERARSRGELQGRFLQRNRIIAGLADVVMVAEAADRSGSLNTATNALNYGVELMVVPGDINRENSRGCNKLLAQGAQPYTGPDDLLNLLFPERKTETANEKDAVKRRLTQLANNLETESERKVVALVLTGVQDGEQIVKRLGMTTPEFNQTVTILEIKGVLKPLAMNRWMVRG